MTVPELLGLLLAIVGLAFAFETPRRWFLRALRLHRKEDRPAAVEKQKPLPLAQTSLPTAELPVATLTPATSGISVQEIIDAINASPPFQQHTVAAHYVGITVEWEGFLRKVEQDLSDDSLVRVNLITDKSRIVSYSIWFSTHPDKVPEIRTLKRDSKICVAGKIQAASGPGLCVTVEPTSVLILERQA